MMNLNRIHIPVVSDSRGSLAFIEQGDAVPFVPSSVWLACGASHFDGLGVVVALRGTATVGGMTLGDPSQGLLFSDGCDVDVSPGGVALVVGAGASGGIAVPFEMKRIYYIWNVPSDRLRGDHAHLRQRSLLMAAPASYDSPPPTGTAPAGRPRPATAHQNICLDFISRYLLITSI
ncbi:MAG: WxcM-like domain-containing protein, partial [Paramuribaculum sp.]|nr:WxcM-like domain-containing protein [Paramuribaculum sp.]